MSDIFASGRIVDLILVLMFMEAIVLTFYYRRTGEGVTPSSVASLLIPGAFLLLAVRGALTGAAWHWIALLLLAAFMAHLADIKQRWRS